MNITFCVVPQPVTFTNKWRQDSAALGFIDPTDHIISVAQFCSDPLAVLVHEYGHLHQWMEGEPTWKAFSKCKINWDTPYEKLSKRNLEISTRLTSENELDCERRAVGLIRDYDLPISEKEYCRGANANVLLYNAIRRMGRHNIKSVSQDRKLIAKMPNCLDSIDYTDINSWHVDQIIKHSF